MDVFLVYCSFDDNCEIIVNQTIFSSFFNMAQSGYAKNKSILNTLTRATLFCNIEQFGEFLCRTFFYPGLCGISFFVPV